MNEPMIDKLNDKALIEYIANEILSVANLYNEVTTSDLQGIADATARTILKQIKNQ